MIHCKSIHKHNKLCQILNKGGSDNTFVWFYRSMFNKWWIIVLSLRHSWQPSALQWKRRRPRTLRDLPIPDQEPNGRVQNHRSLDGSAPSECERWRFFPSFLCPLQLMLVSAFAMEILRKVISALQLHVRSPTPLNHFTVLSSIFKGVNIQGAL